MSTTFKQHAPGMHNGYEYGRSGNPTRIVLEECLAPLEKAKYALTFASGLGALTSLSFLLKSGDHIVTVVSPRMFNRPCAKLFVYCLERA
jgi:cystathionine gamma-lyase